MSIVNNPNIFYMACGLVVSKGDNYTYWNTANGFIYNLISIINKTRVDSNISEWFHRAETGKLNTNPYWPRGSAMQTATFFVKDSDFDMERFLDFFYGSGKKDPISDDDFLNWISELPYVLEYMKNKFMASSGWVAWCDIVESAKNEWEHIIKQSQDILSDFYVQNAPNILFSPNLLIDYQEANSVRVDNNITVISLWPDLESILREALRPEILKHYDKFKLFEENNRLDGFADFSKMQEYGYMLAFETHEDYKLEFIRIAEECFIRGISVIMSGGGVKRLAEQANSGFGSVPYIGSCFMQEKPNIENIGDFISNVLHSFK